MRKTIKLLFVLTLTIMLSLSGLYGLLKIPNVKAWVGITPTVEATEPPVVEEPQTEEPQNNEIDLSNMTESNTVYFNEEFEGAYKLIYKLNNALEIPNQNPTTEEELENYYAGYTSKIHLSYIFGQYHDFLTFDGINDFSSPSTADIIKNFPIEIGQDIQYLVVYFKPYKQPFNSTTAYICLYDLKFTLEITYGQWIIVNEYLNVNYYNLDFNSTTSTIILDKTNVTVDDLIFNNEEFIDYIIGE